MERTDWLPPPIVFDRRSRTESCFWNELMESAGRLSLRFCRYGGRSTAAQISTRMMSTKRVTLQAYLCDSRNVTGCTTRVVDGGLRPSGQGNISVSRPRLRAHDRCYGSTTRPLAPASGPTVLSVRSEPERVV